MRLVPTSKLLGCLYPIAWLVLMCGGIGGAFAVVPYVFDGSPYALLFLPAFGAGPALIYLLALVWRVIPARCQRPGCPGLAYLHGDFQYRCALCGFDNTDTAGKMSGNWRPDWIERLSHERIAPVLRSLSRRHPEGRLSLAQPRSEGALSEPAQPGAVSVSTERVEGSREAPE